MADSDNEKPKIDTSLVDAEREKEKRELEALLSKLADSARKALEAKNQQEFTPTLEAVMTQLQGIGELLVEAHKRLPPEPIKAVANEAADYLGTLLKSFVVRIKENPDLVSVSNVLETVEVLERTVSAPGFFEALAQRVLAAKEPVGAPEAEPLENRFISNMLPPYERARALIQMVEKYMFPKARKLASEPTLYTVERVDHVALLTREVHDLIADLNPEANKQNVLLGELPNLPILKEAEAAQTAVEMNIESYSGELATVSILSSWNEIETKRNQIVNRLANDQQQIEKILGSLSTERASQSTHLINRHIPEDQANTALDTVFSPPTEKLKTLQKQLEDLRINLVHQVVRGNINICRTQITKFTECDTQAKAQELYNSLSKVLNDNLALLKMYKNEELETVLQEVSTELQNSKNERLGAIILKDLEQNPIFETVRRGLEKGEIGLKTAMHDAKSILDGVKQASSINFERTRFHNSIGLEMNECNELKMLITSEKRRILQSLGNAATATEAIIQTKFQGQENAIHTLAGKLDILAVKFDQALDVLNSLANGSSLPRVMILVESFQNQD